MKIALAMLCLLLGGCFSANVTSSPDIAPLVGKSLKIQRPSLVDQAKIMKDPFWGGELDVLILSELPKDYADRVARGWEKTSVLVPVGTELRIERVQRRNLIDHGVEVLAFGLIRHPQTGKMEPFAFELTADGGNVVVRAPWEDSSVPEVRTSEMKGMRDFSIGAPTSPKKSN